jgi:hypothetical protein
MTGQWQIRLQMAAVGERGCYPAARCDAQQQQPLPRSLCARERHETNRNRAPMGHPHGRLLDERQPLLARTDGNNQSPFVRELIHESLWHLFGRRGHDNSVERRVLRPAGVSGAFTNVNVRVTQRVEQRGCSPGQFRHDLDAVHLARKMRERLPDSRSRCRSPELCASERRQARRSYGPR